GLGEVAVFVFMGPVMVLGAYYVMAHDVDWLPIMAALPISFTVAAIMHANNVRDMDADRSVNKRTLAVRFGLRCARALYTFLVAGAYVALVALVLLGVIPWPALLALLTIPEAARLIDIITTSGDSLLLHQAQGRTARLHGRFGFLIVAGWALWLVVERLIA